MVCCYVLFAVVRICSSSNIRFGFDVDYFRKTERCAYRMNRSFAMLKYYPSSNKNIGHACRENMEETEEKTEKKLFQDWIEHIEKGKIHATDKYRNKKHAYVLRKAIIVMESVNI